MNQPVNKILGAIAPFYEALMSALKKDGIDPNHYICDHFCYRVETLERYRILKNELGQIGQMISEKEIGGRPIATFLLKEPLTIGNHLVECIELPAPKKGISYKEGFEHLELVINESFETFIARYPHIEFEMKGANKPVNPEIRVKYGTLSVKFHHYPLSYVIQNLDG